MPSGHARNGLKPDQPDMIPPPESMKDPTLLSEAMREWNAARPLEAGNLICEHLQPRERPGWAAGALELVCRRFSPVAAVETVLRLAHDPSRWREGHAAFQAVRRLTLQVERCVTSEAIDPQQYAFLLLAENTAKVTYNASGAPCPFDLISGARVAAHLHRLADLANEPEFRQQAWEAISRGALCPHWSAIEARMSRDKTAILAAPGARDVDGATALMHAATLGCSAIIRELLTLGADINAADRRGATALMYAVDSGDPVIIHLLAKAGAQVNRTTEDGETALMFAAAHGVFALVEALIHNLADWRFEDKRGRTALSRAEQLADPEIAQMLSGIDREG